MPPAPVQIRTILFDLDGTLVDTEPAAAQAISNAFKTWGIQVTHEDAGYITGRTWQAAFDYLFRKYPIPMTDEKAAELMIGEYRKALREKLHVVPGSADAVKALSERFPLALVSGSHRQEILFALDMLGVRDRFKTILGAEDYVHSKPNPEGYLKAARELGSDPAHSLVFEDSEAGIASARAAGMWVVAISGTNHFRQNTSDAHHSIPDLRGVNAAWITDLATRLGKAPR